MGKSYAEKVKTRQKNNKSNQSRPKRPIKNEERSDKFPIAPMVVLGIVISLIIATIVIYQVQNSDDGGNDPNGDNGGNGGGDPSGLPDFAFTSIENVNGGILSLDQYEGKVVVLDMFATWCGPCADQMVELQDLSDRYSGGEVVILSVDVDLRESTSDVLNFRSDYPQADWVFAMSNNEFNGHFPASSIPTLYILNKELQIVETEVGVTSSASLQAKIAPHL